MKFLLKNWRAPPYNNTKKKQIVVRTIKEFFNKSSVLGKELDVYKTLNKAHGLKEKDAEKLLSEIKKTYWKNIQPENVYKAQSRLISKINKNISPNVCSEL